MYDTLCLKYQTSWSQMEEEMNSWSETSSKIWRNGEIIDFKERTCKNRDINCGLEMFEGGDRGDMTNGDIECLIVFWI